MPLPQARRRPSDTSRLPIIGRTLSQWEKPDGDDRATRGASACAARGMPQICNIQSSILNPVRAMPGQASVQKSLNSSRNNHFLYLIIRHADDLLEHVLIVLPKQWRPLDVTFSF